MSRSIICRRPSLSAVASTGPAGLNAAAHSRFGVPAIARTWRPTVGFHSRTIAVVAAGGEQRAGGAEPDVAHPPAVAAHRVHAGAGDGVPQAGGQLVVADGELAAVGAERERPHRSGVAGEPVPQPSRRGVPEADRAGAVAAGEQVTGRAERDAVDGAAVAFQGVAQLARGDVPHAHVPVGVAGGQQGFPRMGVDREDVLGVAREVDAELARRGVPPAQPPAGPGRDQRVGHRHQPVHGAVGRAQLTRRSARRRVPEPHDAVAVGGHDEARVEGDAEDEAARGAHPVAQGAGRDVPQPHGALRVPGGHDVLRRTQHDRPRPLAVPGQDVAHLPGRRVPQPHRAVARARDEHVAAVDHREHPAGVALQRAQRPPAHGAAHQHAAVVAADRQRAAVGAVGQGLGEPAQPGVEAVPDADGGGGELGADRAAGRDGRARQLRCVGHAAHVDQRCARPAAAGDDRAGQVGATQAGAGEVGARQVGC